MNTLAYSLQLAENVAVTNAWFAGFTRFGGDTYIVGSFDDGVVNAGLVAVDIVVKITGLPDLTYFGSTGAADSSIRL